MAGQARPGGGGNARAGGGGIAADGSPCCCGPGPCGCTPYPAGAPSACSWRVTIAGVKGPATRADATTAGPQGTVGQAILRPVWATGGEVDWTGTVVGPTAAHDPLNQDETYPTGPACGYCGYTSSAGTLLGASLILCFAAGGQVVLNVSNNDTSAFADPDAGTYYRTIFQSTAVVRTDGTYTYENEFQTSSGTVRKFYAGTVTLTPLDAAGNPIGGSP